jgi:tetratricopeptide (TPR) repeat protein
MTFVNKSTPSEKVLRLMDAALDLQRAGERARALEILEQVQEQAPDYAPLHLLIGLAYRDAGQLEEAEAGLRRAIELDPEQTEAIQSLGLLLATQGRSTDAVKWLKRRAELQPYDSVTLKALGAQMARLDRQEEAVKLLEEAWKNTESVEVGITYGRYLIRIRQWELAEEVLHQVADTAPQPKPLVEWAYALVLLERHQDALKVLQQILEIDPSFDRAWRGVSTCYLNLGQLSEALEAAERALAVDDRHCRNWLAKANALLKLERYTELLEAARIGAECVPSDDTEARPVLQELRLREVEGLFSLDRPDEALAHLGQLRRQLPTEERLTQFQVQMLKELGRPEQALNVLDEAHEAGVRLDGALAPLRYETLHLLNRPNEAWDFIQPLLATQTEHRLDVLGNIGVSFYTQGRVQAAQSVFEQLSEFAPQLSRFACNLGFILTGEGKLSEAERHLLRALDLPDNEDTSPLVLANLGYLYLIQGDYTKAEASLQQAASLAAEQQEGILRIAYWQDGQVVPDFTPHPTYWILVRAAAQANQVTLAMAGHQIEEAEALARKMVQANPDASWGYKMLGWVLCTESKVDEARNAWESALHYVTVSQEKGIIEQWLKGLSA